MRASARTGGLLVSSGGQGCFVVVGPDHEVYVFYYRGTGGGGQGGDNRLFVRKSTDHGVTFGSEVEGRGPGDDDRTNGGLGLNGGLRSNSFPHAAVNPVTGTSSSSTTTTRPRRRPTDGDIFYVTSTNNGATLVGRRCRSTSDGRRDQFFPTVSISPDGERVMFGYYSRSHDPNNLYVPPSRPDRDDEQRRRGDRPCVEASSSAPTIRS